MIKLWALTLCFLVSSLTLEAQDSSGSSSKSSSTRTESQAFLGSNAPLWLRDLRRGEIVAFGSFPFTFFVSNLAMDVFRSSQHDWDTRYAPWPIKSAGAVNMTQDEFMTTLSIAVGGAVLISILDQIVIHVKRNKAAKAAALLPKGNPIITRKPWPEGEEAEENAPLLESGPPEDVERTP